jgi:hypothetical protein
MIINDNSSIIKKFEASLTDEARVNTYDRHMFIVEATEWSPLLMVDSYPRLQILA